MNTMTEKRDINVVTAEIVTITHATQKLVLDSSIEIGRRLCEAKELIGHGGWGEYLKTQVQFSESTAQNLMRIFREYGDEQLELGKLPKSQTFGDLTYSQAIALLALPEEDREDVVNSHDMESTTIAELKAIIAEKSALLQEAETKVEQGENIVKDRDRLQGLVALKEKEAADLTAKAADLERELEALEEAAADGDNSIGEEDIQTMLADATAAARQETEKKLKADFAAEKKRELDDQKTKHREQLEKVKAEMQKTSAELEAAREDARARAEEAQKLKNSAVMNGIPEVDRFKERFEGLQNEISRIVALITEVKGKDEPAGEKLKGAMLKYADIFKSQMEAL